MSILNCKKSVTILGGVRFITGAFLKNDWRVLNETGYSFTNE